MSQSKHVATQMPTGGWVISMEQGRAMTEMEAKAALRSLDAAERQRTNLGMSTSEELIDELSRRHAGHLIVIEHQVDGKPGETRLRVHSSLAVWTAMGLVVYAQEALRCRARSTMEQAPDRRFDG